LEGFFLIEDVLLNWGYWISRLIPGLLIILVIGDLCMVPRAIKNFKKRKNKENI